jgi:hypothetical protein
MEGQKRHFNPHLSVDCVVFGFQGDSLKVLLIERYNNHVIGSNRKFKLPGDLIIEMEDLDGAAMRVLRELTGLKDVFLTQFAVFGHPERISEKSDIEWLESTSGVKITRVVTTAYMSLIRIDKSRKENALSNNASWHEVTSLPPLAFDHREIIEKGLERLRYQIRFEPICFELLPGKFTVRQIQTMYECILQKELDNRNFRKKLLKAPYLEPLAEKQNGVAHKPARYYRFNREKFKAGASETSLYNF